jgi:hypothetical protein
MLTTTGRWPIEGRICFDDFLEMIARAPSCFVPFLNSGRKAV